MTKILPGQPIAFLFPGQGAQEPGMGVELVQHFPEVEETLQMASDLVGADLKSMLQRGGHRLEKTSLLQPTMTALSLGVLSLFEKRNIQCDWAAGHSLGELAAWCAVGGICPQSAIELAWERGKAMERETHIPGGMLALSSIDENPLEEALAIGRRHGILVIAAHNAPNDWVLSGEIEAIKAVQRTISSTRLHTSGAWHSPLMKGAELTFRATLQRLKMKPHRAKLVSNRRGEICSSNIFPEELIQQLTHPVRWTSTLQTILHAGVQTFVLMACQRTLRSLLRKNIPPSLQHSLTIMSAVNHDDTQQTIMHLQRKIR